MSANVGDRVVAILSAKAGKVMVLGEGEYLGLKVPEEGVPGGEFFHELKVPNPAIKLDNGVVVYGFECWWGPVHAMESRFKDCEVVVVPVSEYRPQKTGSSDMGKDNVPSL